MYRRVHMLLSGLSALIATAQNMVPNPSFEEYGEAPCSWVISHETFNEAFREWIMPTSGSTDMFSTLVDPTCYASAGSINRKAPGTQAPRTGEIMAAIWTYGNGCVPGYREYLEIKLDEPLIPGFMYYAEFYVSCADHMKFASNNLGIYFSETLVYNESLFGNLNYIPQINHQEVVSNTKDWVKISGTILAVEPSHYIVIGNFYGDAETTATELGGDGDDARYFIDDVMVKCLTCITFETKPGLKVKSLCEFKQGFWFNIARKQQWNALLPKRQELMC